MKLRRLVVAGILVSVFMGVYLLAGRESKEQRALEETRRSLREQGFKVALDEFNFFAPPELRDRAQALTNSVSRWFRPSQTISGENVLMSQVGSNSALIFWKRQSDESPEDAEFWAKQRELFETKAEQLNQAAEAALSGPFQFDLNAAHGGGMLLPHVATLRNLSQMFGERAMLDLHEGHPDVAWTNVLAATRIVTAWNIETIEIPFLVRCACFDTTYNTIWQGLQAHAWSDDQLAQLQHEVEAVDFFRGMADTTAFSRASMANSCQQERQTKPPLLFPFRQMLHFPKSAWASFADYRRQVQYREHGTYQEENGLLLFFRDREAELRRAVQSASWSEMRQLPGITNPPVFKSNYPSRTHMMMNQRQMQMSFQRARFGLAGQAAKAEAQRRVIITAIALERYRHRAGSYPPSLAELTPEFLPKPPVDFMDGQPLRYHRNDDGRFLLYSVGLDCVDNGGCMKRADKMESASPNLNLGRIGQQGPGVAEGTDLVWPLPATDAEVEAWAKGLEDKAAAQKAAAKARQRSNEEQAETNRRATVALLLNDARYKKTTWRGSDDDSKPPQWKGQPLNQYLRNPNSSGTNQLSLDEMFTLKQVITGLEPEVLTYQLPIRYSATTNFFRGGELTLVMDSPPEEPGLSQPELQNCERATNGDCLLVWNTAFERQGQHALQAVLLADIGIDKEMEVKGPVLPFCSSNICKFFLGNSMFDDTGAGLSAELPESNGIFSIKIKDPSGKRVKTMTGSTSNGVINVEWDLLDEQGHKYTNDQFESCFNIRLPESGRSGTLKRAQSKMGGRPPEAN